MRWSIITFIFFLTLTMGLVLNNSKARAQLISEQPLCLKILNTTEGEVLGHVETAEFYDAQGKLSWHRSNFRLGANLEQEVCSTGPFFDGYHLRVVVKTLMPLYSCLTEMNRTLKINKETGKFGIVKVTMDCPSELDE